MTAAEMQELINQRVYLPIDGGGPLGGMLVECVVKNAKQAYGKLRVQVIPMAGKGEAWVDVARVRLVEEA